MYLKQTKNSLLSSDRIAGSIYEFVKMDMPYMIIYEMTNLENDVFSSIEYSEYKNLACNYTYKEYVEYESLPLHTHDFYEITFVLSGKLTMQFEEEKVTFNPGDGVLSNKNVHHREIMDQNAEIVLFLLEEKFIKDLLEQNYSYDEQGWRVPIGSFFYELFSDNKKTPFYNVKEYIEFRLKDEDAFERFLELVRQMITEITERHSGKRYMMKALLCRMIECLEDTGVYNRETHSAKLSNEEEILRGILYAYENSEGIFTRAEIETITGYNSDYIERIAKKRTGKTLSEIGRGILLRKSAELLAETDMKIGTICEKAGYSNRSYFNKIFSETYGITPSEYRRRNKVQKYTTD
ncbi:response regulator transcription factor [uncultured Eubacterium sp.]|uniref:helix-turn-helix domain-containing protein n=1 Tax=uncultured Eubacterium sp. TaxID=165185 RepID=UPI0026006D3D|nr:response regulator transcription factor [uncultured Eubacterium sp.]